MANATGTLIASISGIRGIFGDGLDPGSLVRYAAAFGTWCRQRSGHAQPTVIIGRDARITGEICAGIVSRTLQSTGCTVISAGMATTPTVEMAVLAKNASAGIVISASHNPPEWNALKLLNEKGEFLSASEGEKVLELAESEQFSYVGYNGLGGYSEEEFLSLHIDSIRNLPFIEEDEIAASEFEVVVDGVNSVGGVAIPQMLLQLGVQPSKIHKIHCEPTGHFAHPAEPLPDHLEDLRQAVPSYGADLGLAVDPDADRLALVDEHGSYVSEELTQVIAADFLWGFRSGPFVTNLSSSRAIEDVAERYGMSVHRSAVGEINVVEKMKEVSAILGGEGNGGVILPDLHFGRDSLVAVAMILQHLARTNSSLSTLRKTLPSYTIVKRKIPLEGMNATSLLPELAKTVKDGDVSTLDGLKVDYDKGWVHVRPSNTEPVLRIYAEAQTADMADELARDFELRISRMQESA